LNIANETVTGSGTVIIKDTEENSVYVGNPARRLEKTAKELFGV
jgi:acetyltransferase-like isoleucine patch superfamily enzyme